VRGRIDVHRQNRYLLTQFLDGEHAHELNICSVPRQVKSERTLEIFSTILVLPMPTCHTRAWGDS
jgi:hypothetical protein